VVEPTMDPVVWLRKHLEHADRPAAGDGPHVHPSPDVIGGGELAVAHHPQRWAQVHVAKPWWRHGQSKPGWCSTGLTGRNAGGYLPSTLRPSASTRLRLPGRWPGSAPTASRTALQHTPRSLGHPEVQICTGSAASRTAMESRSASERWSFRFLNDPRLDSRTEVALDEARDFFFKVWPPVPRRLSWPPRYHLDDEGLDAMAFPF
jgi:hypothetical protein